MKLLFDMAEPWFGCVMRLPSPLGVLYRLVLVSGNHRCLFYSKSIASLGSVWELVTLRATEMDSKDLCLSHYLFLWKPCLLEQ